MKKLSVVVAAAALILFSCDKLGLTSKKMDTVAGVEFILKGVEKYVDFNEYKVVDIRWFEDEKLSNDCKVVHVSMVNSDNKVYSQTFILSGPGEGAGKLDTDRFNKADYDFATMEWLDPREVDASRIVDYIEEAKEYIPEGYSFESVHSIRLHANDNSKTRPISFDLNITEDGKSRVKNAGQTMIEYYEINFYVDDNGELVLKQ